MGIHDALGRHSSAEVPEPLGKARAPAAGVHDGTSARDLEPGEITTTGGARPNPLDVAGPGPQEPRGLVAVADFHARIGSDARANAPLQQLAAAGQDRDTRAEPGRPARRREVGKFLRHV